MKEKYVIHRELNQLSFRPLMWFFWPLKCGFRSVLSHAKSSVFNSIYFPTLMGMERIKRNAIHHSVMRMANAMLVLQAKF